MTLNHNKYARLKRKYSHDAEVIELIALVGELNKTLTASIKERDFYKKRVLKNMEK